MWSVDDQVKGERFAEKSWLRVGEEPEVGGFKSFVSTHCPSQRPSEGRHQQSTV